MEIVGDSSILYFYRDSDSKELIEMVKCIECKNLMKAYSGYLKNLDWFVGFKA